MMAWVNSLDSNPINQLEGNPTTSTGAPSGSDTLFGQPNMKMMGSDYPTGAGQASRLDFVGF